MLLVNKLAVAQPANVSLHGTRPWHPKNPFQPPYVCSHTDGYLPFMLFIQKHLPVSVSSASYDSLV